jgi:phosphatidylglycerol:prolipoprotein diacylglycerol transferase
MLMLGFILAIYVTTKRARLAGIKPEFITDLAIWAIIVGVIGARVAYILEWKSPEEQRPFDEGWRIFNIFDGNVSWLGAVLGLVLMAAIILINNRFGRKKVVFKDDSGVRKGAVIAVVVIAVVVGVACARAWRIGFGTYNLNVGGQSVVRHIYDDYNLRYFAIRDGGLTFYGGFLPAALALILLTWRRGYNTWKVADVIVPSVMLGLSFGRIGCFLNGCCWGLVCKDGFWSNLAVRFPKITDSRDPTSIVGSLAFKSQLDKNLVSLGEQSSLPVIPTELIESVFAFGLFLFLSWHIGRKRRNGEALALGAGIYAVGRFLIEFLRGDHDAKWLGLSFSQSISMGVFAAAVGFFLYLRFGGSSSGGVAVEAAKAPQAAKP